ncbi:MAG: hypothetical protein LBG20_01675, partial [Holosporaceae bacterium]|nr:hypothetical protein [Holosporaceae bacterium]
MVKFQDQIGKIIAIDGKASRHSFDESQTMLHTVSAYATEARLVLVQEKATKLYGDSSVVERIGFERNYSHHRCDRMSAWNLETNNRKRGELYFGVERQSIIAPS